MSSAWIDAGGGNAKACSFVELPIPLIPNAVASGKIDGGMLVDPYLEEATSSGGCRAIGYPFNLIAKNFGVTYFFCTKSFAAANADALKAFRKGLADATRYALAHKSEMVPLIVDYTKMDRAIVDKMPLDVGVGIDAAQLQSVIDFSAKIKSIPASFPATDMIDPAALAKS